MRIEITVRFTVYAPFPHHLPRAAYEWLDTHGFAGAWSLDLTVEDASWSWEDGETHRNWKANVAATSEGMGA